jgi:hypothetical protein
MISIFIMYSTDRSEALSHTLACLRQMPLYDNCQKTLIVDGKIDQIPQDWEVVQVPRVDNNFCWGRMWDAGVCSAQFEKVIYLDSDRLLPKNYLQLIDENLEDDIFIFTSVHFMMKRELLIEECKRMLSYDTVEELMADSSILGTLQYEVRNIQPLHGPGKNVMSGSTAFKRSTYLNLGGVDQWYCGHGAFADSDFHMQATVAGCKFMDLSIPELHYPHHKFGENKNPLKEKELWLLGLNNFIYYCDKWGLPMVLAESLAARCGVKRPFSYVSKKLKEIKEVSMVF